MSLKHTAGYVYAASNLMMPGLIKAGRTQTSVAERSRTLYSTGVPCAFLAERTRFLVDCIAAERRYLQELSTIGKCCENREFFQVDKTLAAEVLEVLYRNQYKAHDHKEADFYFFEASANECFRELYASNKMDFAEQISLTLEVLPTSRRDSIKRTLLAHVIEQRDKCFAIWLVRKCAVDPEEPMQHFVLSVYVRDYYLTAYESAIYFHLPILERYLHKIGCDLSHSSALCYVVDGLINENINGEAKEKIAEFGVDLIERGIDTKCMLDVPRFADAAIARPNYRFDIFPRSSNQACDTLIAVLAAGHERFARLDKCIRRLLQR